MLLRAILSLALMTAAGAVGYYFWLHGTEAPDTGEVSRQRTVVGTAELRPQGPTLPEAPRVDTGRGAAPALPPQGQVVGAAQMGQLATRRLGLPIANLRINDLVDTFDEARGTQAQGKDGRRHEATD